MAESKLPEVEFREGFIPYMPGQTDNKAQEKYKIHKIEELIFKPVHVGLENMTEEEIEEYLKINTEELDDSEIGIKTIMICEATQEIIRKGKKSIIEVARKKEEKKKEESRDEQQI